MNMPNLASWKERRAARLEGAGGYETWAEANAASVHTRALAAAACVIPAGLVLITQSHWQIELQYPGTQATHAIARAIKPTIQMEPLSVIDVEAPGFAVAIDYDLHRPAGASQPFLTTEQANHQGYALDLRGVEMGRCPHLMRWSQHGWIDVASSSLLSGCIQ